jgi:hypothetical protein
MSKIKKLVLSPPPIATSLEVEDACKNCFCVVRRLLLVKRFIGVIFFANNNKSIIY